MRLSKLFKQIGISCECKNEKDFLSLGLTEYNDGKAVCTFVTAEKYLQHISDEISMIITTAEIANSSAIKQNYFGVCVVENPRIAFFTLHNYLTNDPKYVRDERNTIVGENCNISPLAMISTKNVVIGNNVVIEEFCSIKENTIIGDNCIIRAGSVIGMEGFEFKEDGDGIFRVHHVGGVQIGHDVEIQGNTCVDKAIYPWDNTLIGDYAKIDNLVHIAHGVKIGRAVMIIANSAIGGRTVIGEKAWIGIGAQIRNGMSIGTNARANMGAVVTKNVADNESVTGNFAIKHDNFIKNMKENISR